MLYYFDNHCQDQANIRAYLISQPPVISGGYAVNISDFTGTEITYKSADVSSGLVSTIIVPSAMIGCDQGTQAMMMTGIDNLQKVELAGGLIFVLVSAWAIKTMKNVL